MAAWVMLLIPFAIGYPWIVDFALTRYGVRVVALVALALGSISLLASWRRSRRSDHPKLVLCAQLCGLSLAALAATLAARWPLLLVPGLIQLFLALIFWRSLALERSMVERVARMMQPYAPEWISGYCRGVTALWTLFFLLNAALILALALLASETAWTRYTGGGLYLVALALQGVEAAARKLWFRNYGNSPIDRLIRRLFPPEDTERGRRSMAHIREMRQRLGMEMPR